MSNENRMLSSLVTHWLNDPDLSLHDSGCCCGVGLFPDPGTSICSKPKKKKKGGDREVDQGIGNVLEEWDGMEARDGGIGKRLVNLCVCLQRHI